MAEIAVESVVVGFSGAGPAYQVFIDGKAMGVVAGGETRRFIVAPGVHMVRLAAAGIETSAVKVAVSGRTELQCRTQRRWSMFAHARTETRIVVREACEAASPAGLDMRPRLMAGAAA